ncbi:MAG: ABC transporter ATP-binding protein [Rhodospirillales bacterium]|nr:ABC transporter ATP-binding protein [Rhodospirillales bacterium]
MSDLLRFDGVRAGYGEAQVLDEVSLTLEPGKSLALLGRNGTGKTTLLNTVLGLTRMIAGRILFDGRDIARMPAHGRAALGIGWVPQERNIFRSLTVEENLTAVARPGPWTVDRIYELFPRLKERRTNMGTQLSGGEQQMLAVGRALVLNPRLLLLDEPLEGLAPIIVEELLAVFRRLAADGSMGIILVEQHARKILAMTDHAAILDRGAIVHAASSRDLLRDEATLARHLGVAA